MRTNRRILLIILVLLVSTGGRPATNTQIPKSSYNGLTCYWHMNANENPIQTSSIKNHPGTLTNAFYSPNGRISGCVGFNGINAHVLTPDASDLSFTDENFTIALWVLAVSTSLSTTPSVIVSKYATGGIEYILYLDLSGGIERIGFNTYDPPAASAGIVTYVGSGYDDDQWHWLVFTCDSTTLTIYVDGVYGNSGASTGEMDNTGSQLAMGYAQGGLESWLYDGWLDEVAIFNRCLSPTEIKNIYYSNWRSKGSM